MLSTMGGGTCDPSGTAPTTTARIASVRSAILRASTLERFARWIVCRPGVSILFRGLKKDSNLSDIPHRKCGTDGTLQQRVKVSRFLECVHRGQKNIGEGLGSTLREGFQPWRLPLPSRGNPSGHNVGGQNRTLHPPKTSKVELVLRLCLCR